MKKKNRNRVVVIIALVFIVVLVVAFIASPGPQSFIHGFIEGFNKVKQPK